MPALSSPARRRRPWPSSPRCKRRAAPAPRGPAPPAAQGEALKYHEVRYQEARERIFGKDAERSEAKEGKEGDGADRDRDKEKHSGVAPNPRGPQPANAAAQKGFKARIVSSYTAAFTGFRTSNVDRLDLSMLIPNPQYNPELRLFSLKCNVDLAKHVRSI
ncbi:hypothetical protein FB451DRAFT_1185166 [Mycena latifolia]|nr:hypothetical protein FB451DRAFT_1185166 [Mycena latifolia]